MTIEELKAEAKAMGFKVIPSPTLERLKVCTCGGKRRERWYTDGGVFLICKRCRREVYGATEAEARRNWNRGIDDAKMQKM